MKMGLWLLVLLVVVLGGCGYGCAMGDSGGMIARNIEKHRKSGKLVLWETPYNEGYVSVEMKSSLVGDRTTLTHISLGGVCVKPLESGKSLGVEEKKLGDEQASSREENDEELRRSGLVEKKKRRRRKRQLVRGSYHNAQIDVKGISRIRPNALLESKENILSKRPSKKLASLHERTTENRRATYEMSVYAGEGQFLTILRIGTPPVAFTAIVDTGSDLVWRQCMPCKECYPQSPSSFPIFNPALSSTYHNASCSDPLCHEAQLYGGSCTLSCQYNNPYDDPPAYTRGDLAFDTLSISDISGYPHQAAHFAFGCSHASHGPYNFAGAGGIAGFGQGNLSLPSQLGVKKFSYCFPRMTMWSISSPHTQQSVLPSSSLPSAAVLQQSLSSSRSSTFSSSTLLLGEGATLSGGGGADIQSTLILDDDNPGYSVEFQGISVSGRRLSIPTSALRQGRMIIDSGTTFTTLSPQVFHAVYAAFTALITQKRTIAAVSRPRNLSLCYHSLPSPMPSLSFHFKGAQIHLPPNNYFIFIDSLYCLAIMESRDSQSIYGNVQQQDFHILYDLHTRHISFEPTSCSLH